MHPRWRTIYRWIHLVFDIPILVLFIVRFKKFQTMPPLFGLSSFLYSSFRNLDVEGQRPSTTDFEQAGL